MNNIIKHRKKNNKIVEVLVTWKGEPNQSNWINMNSLIMQDPEPIIKYALCNHLQNQPILRKVLKLSNNDSGNWIARAYNIKMNYCEKKFKFGVQVPRGTKEAYLIDELNKDKLWKEAIAKELHQLNSFKTFLALEVEAKPTTGYKRVPYHIVYDVKFDGRRKARLVTNLELVHTIR